MWFRPKSHDVEMAYNRACAMRDNGTLQQFIYDTMKRAKKMTLVDKMKDQDYLVVRIVDEIQAKNSRPDAPIIILN